jgi:O-antigen/teichoic acid export membrane protein
VSSISHKTASASIWTLGGKFSARLLDFISLLILARVLSPEDFGLVAIATSVLVIVEAVLDMPLVQALVRQKSPSPEMIATAFTLGVLRSLAIILAMIAIAWPLAAVYNDQRLFALVSVLSLGPALRSIVSPGMVIFMQQLDFRRDFLLDIIARATTLVAAVSISLSTGSYWGLALGTVSGQLVATMLSYVFAPMRPAFVLSEWKRFQDMVGWNTLSQILDSINWQLDRLLLPRFTGIATFGSFSVADNIASIPHQTFVGPLMRPLMAGFKDVSDDKRRVAFLKAISAATLVAAPVLLTMVVLAEPIVRVVVGERWLSSAPILQFLCIVSLIGLPSTILPPLVMVLDKTRYVALRMGLEFAIRVPVTVFGIIYYGVPGAIAGRMTAVTIAHVASLFVARHLIQAPMMAQLKAFLRPLSASLPMVLFLYLTQPYLAALPIGFNLVLGLAICIGIGLALFWTCALLSWWVAGKPDGLESLIVLRLKMPVKGALSV